MTFYPATPGDYFLACLERFMVRAGQGRHFGVTVVRLAAPPDLDALRRTWKELFLAQPLLGAQLRRRWRDWRLGWVADGPSEAPPLVHHDSPFSLAASVVDDRLGGRIDGRAIDTALHLDLFADHTVLLTWRHHLLDGVGLNLLIDQLGSGVVAEAETPRPDSIKKTSFKTAMPAVATLRQITSLGNRSAWQRATPLQGLPRFEVIELDAAASARAAAACRQYCGEVFHMPFFAAVAARALRLVHKVRGLPEGGCHLEVLFQKGTRPAGRLLRNHMSTLTLAIEMRRLDSLSAGVAYLLDLWQQALRKRLPEASAALMAVMMRLPTGLTIPLIRLMNQGEICGLFHSHTGTFLPGRSHFAEAPVLNVFNIPAVSAPPGLGIFFSDFQDKLTVTLAWRDGCLSSAEVDAVIAQMTADLDHAKSLSPA